MDIIFNLFKVKFKLLDELITRECELTQNSKVNIFINLDSVFNKLGSSPNIENEIQLMNDKKKSYMLISNIINLAAHYRLFFSKNNIYSRVFIYTTYPFNANIKNKSIFPEYRYPYTTKFTNKPSNILLKKLIDDNINLASIIMEYINGVYFIETHSFENSLVPFLITEQSYDYENFIVSTDPYDYQYVNKGFNIIRPKKENSFIVTRKNLWNKLEVDTNINTTFYSFVLSVLGDTMRGLPKVKGFGIKTIVKSIEKAISLNNISNNASSITMLVNILKEEYTDTVLTNYRCIDLDFQNSYIHMSGKLEVTKQLVDKFDNIGLKEICDTYFNENPINLNEIMDAYKLVRSNVKVRGNIHW